jgi:three-Cys-motif partner protein
MQGELFSDLPDLRAPQATFSGLRRPVWTENKAQLIAKYLYYFVLITKHGAYIDGFAAPKEPELPNSWAAKLVLDSEPKFLRDFALCDLRSEELENLKAEQPSTPKRRIDLYPGDFNTRVHDVLSSGIVTPKKATFCLIDQYSFECHWDTVRAIASHKREGSKIEQFYFLATGWLERGLSGFSANLDVPERWWGADWRELINIDPHSRALMFCQRFREELGYRHAHPWPIYKKGNRGRIMFHMIHATDHDEAPKIMWRAYRNATNAHEPVEQLTLELEKMLGSDFPEL